jgi:hypothetical protein
MNRLRSAKRIQLGVVGVGLFAMLGAAVSTAAANTGLPYIGERPRPCQVNVPRAEALDGGYLTDEACTTIYVKPPQFGAARMSSHSRTLNLDNCEGINDLNRIQIKAIQDIRKVEMQMQEAQAKLSVNPTEDLLNRIKEMTKLVNSAMELERSMRSYLDSKKSEVGGSVTVTLDNLWGQIVEKYKVLNSPSLNGLVVERMPINAAFLSYDMVRQSEDLALGGISTALSPVIQTTKTTLPVRLPPAMDPSKRSDGELPDSMAPPVSAYAFGNSASITMVLSLLGLCPYTGISSPLRLPGTESLVSYLTPNVTYFYPVASKSFYKVKINASALASAVVQSYQKANVVDASRLAQLLSGGSSLAFEEQSSQDVRGAQSLTPEQKQTIKGQLITYVTEAVLKNIGNLIGALKESSDYQNSNTEVHRGSRCHGKWFWRRCHNYTYEVVVKTPNWDAIARKVESILNASSGTVTSNQSTYEYSDTMAFIPPEEIIKIRNQRQETGGVQ